MTHNNSISEIINKMDLQEIYKEESGYDVGRYNIDNTNYYSEDYVEWLEKKLRIDGVVKSLPQDNYCQVCKLPTDGEKCYSKRCPV